MYMLYSVVLNLMTCPCPFTQQQSPSYEDANCSPPKPADLHSPDGGVRGLGGEGGQVLVVHGPAVDEVGQRAQLEVLPVSEPRLDGGRRLRGQEDLLGVLRHLARLPLVRERIQSI